MDHAQELLQHAHNKYELVLTVARRAKTIRDDASSLTMPEANKPIKLALSEIVEAYRGERETSLI